MEYILLTGGCGYIGSHLAIKMLELGYNIIIIDNLSMTGKIPLGLLYYLDLNSNFDDSELYSENLIIFKCNLESPKLEEIFSSYSIKTVIHLAGFKSVKESVINPLKYYENNLVGTINLLKTMVKCKNLSGINLIFSSSATVYAPSSNPLKETDIVDPSTPYGKTKLIIEQMIADTPLNSIILRYFNPIGCHPLLPESPSTVPENLAPFILMVLQNKILELTIFGNDYNTPDGTCIRDYIHIDDLVEGHLACLNVLDHRPGTAGQVINLGTGRGYSVLEMIQEFEKCGKHIPFKFGPRREGDLGTVCANVNKAEEMLGWKSKYGLKEMITSLINSS